MRHPPRPPPAALSERDVESSNATLNALLGSSHQRSWMTGGLGQSPVRPSPRRPSTSTTTETPLPPMVRASTLDSNSIVAIQSSSTVGSSHHPSNPIHEASPYTSAVRDQRPSNPALSLPNNPIHNTVSSGDVQSILRDDRHSISHPLGSIEDNMAISNEAPRLGQSRPAIPSVSAVNSLDNVIDLLHSPSPDRSLAPPPLPSSTLTANPNVTPHVLSHSTADGQREYPDQFHNAEQRPNHGNGQPSGTMLRTSQVGTTSCLPAQRRASGSSAPRIVESAVPQKRQRTHVPIMPPLKPRVSLIDAYLAKVIRDSGGLPDFERTRFRLLKEACKTEDSFYVAAHQLFCAWDVDQSKVMTLYQVHPGMSLPTANVLQAGFRHLASLLRPNSHLEVRHRMWFAEFPSPLADLIRTSEPYRRIVQAVMLCVARLGDGWSQLSQDCQARNYPPLVEELVDRFGLTSPFLQNIVFTAARRNLGVDDSDLGARMESIFRQDQVEYESLLARVNTNRPPMPQELSERRGRLAGAYSNILTQSSPNQDSTINGHGTTNSHANLQSQVISHETMLPGQLPAPVPGAATSSELNAAAQSMSLESPNPNSGAFIHHPPRPAVSNSRRVSQHRIQDVAPQGRARIRHGPSNAYHGNNEPPVLRSSNSSAPVPQPSSVRQITSQIQSIEAQLSSLQSQYATSSMPVEVYHQQQAFLRQRHILYAQQAAIRSGQHPADLADSNPLQQVFPQTQNGQNQYRNGNMVAQHSLSTPNGYTQQFQQGISIAPQIPNPLQRTSSTANPQYETPLQSNPHTAAQLMPNIPRQNLASMPIQPIEYEVAFQNVASQHWPLIPPTGVFHKLVAPNPDKTALHQAHIRSPILVPLHLSLPESENGKRYYQVVNSLTQSPTKLVASKSVTEIIFTVSQTNHDRIGKNSYGRRGQIPNRHFVEGTLQYRMRCIKRKKDEMDCTESDWVVSDTAWPTSAVFQIKGGPNAPNQQLELRKKALHGKDLPVDLTSYIEHFEPNTNICVTISLPGRPKCLREASYFFAVDIIEIFEHDQLMTMCQQQRRDASTTLDALKTSLQGPTPDEDDDDEISLISSEVTLNLTDPFSSRIFDIPVRGNLCLHRECFDLETFLLSRISKPNKPKHHPTLIDVWRCPICNRDARPKNLHVDKFLCNIRKKLEEMELLDEVKMIVINKDGLWKPKAVNSTSNGVGGGNGVAGAKRKTPGDESDGESDGDESAGVGSRRTKSASVNASVQVDRIVIDLSD